MNVLIVDDEQHARDAVKLLFPWEERGFRRIFEADNGEEAKRTMQEQPIDIVLTDIHMPISSGLSLMEWIQAHRPDTEVIVISGYDDFDYVRHTMKYGGKDYLLKPIDPAELEEAVMRAVDARRKLELKRRHEVEQGIAINRFKPVYRDYLFSQLFHNTKEADDAKQQLYQDFPGFQRAKSGIAAVVGLDAVPAPLLRRFRGDRELLAYAVANIANDLVHDRWSAGYAFRPFGSTDEIVILFWTAPSLAPSRTEEIMQAIFSTFRAPVHAGIGSEEPLPGGIAQSVQRARQALMQRNLLSDRPFAHAPQPPDSKTGPVPQLTDMEEAIHTALLALDLAELEAAVDRWLDAVRSLPAVTPAHLELWTRQYRMMKSKWFESRSAPAPDAREETDGGTLPFAFDEQGRLSLEETGRIWKERLAAIAKSTAAAMRQERHVIGDMIRYIEQHLGEDLSLQRLASRFFLSREYVSRKFRQEMGETLTEFVERLRVDKAKRLLGNRTLKIADIAEMVGYADEKYFSKVFKKQTGESPARYRKKLP